MAPKKQIDWEQGEKLFRLGQISQAEIGKRLGCPTSTVTRHMKSNGITQDKTEEVRQRTRAALVSATQRNDDATQRNDQCVATAGYTPAEVTDEDIAGAVDSNVALILSHRKDISKLAEIEGKLLFELEGEPTKLYLAQYQGKILAKTIGLTVSEKSSTLLALSGVQAKRIALQRQAFNIDDEVARDNELAQVLTAVAGRRTPLVKEGSE